jgi:hypothetical protein
MAISDFFFIIIISCNTVPVVKPTHFIAKATTTAHFGAHYKINYDECVGIYMYRVLLIRTTNAPTMKNMH